MLPFKSHHFPLSLSPASVFPLPTTSSFSCFHIHTKPLSSSTCVCSSYCSPFFPYPSPATRIQEWAILQRNVASVHGEYWEVASTCLKAVLVLTKRQHSHLICPQPFSITKISWVGSPLSWFHEVNKQVPLDCEMHNEAIKGINMIYRTRAISLLVILKTGLMFYPYHLQVLGWQDNFIWAKIKYASSV